MNATFWPLNSDAERDRERRASATVATRATRSCSRSSILPLRTTWPHRSCESAAAPESVRPATTARIVAKATAEMKPRNAGAAEHLGEQRRRHVAALVDRRDRVAADEHRRAEAEDERDEIEEADQRRRVEHRAPRGRARRAPCRTASGCAAGRRCRTSARCRARSPRAGSATSLPGASTPAPYCRARRRTARAGSSRTARARAPRAASRRASSRHGLDDLHPGRRDHAAEQHVREHHDADDRRSPTRTAARTSAGSRLPAPTICAIR